MRRGEDGGGERKSVMESQSMEGKLGERLEKKGCEKCRGRMGEGREEKPALMETHGTFKGKDKVP